MSATAQRPWPDFVRVFAVAGGAALIAGAVATIAVDPYWVFRHSPLWVAWTGGVNRLLDVDMRRAKPLQLFTRPAETVLVGSSTVYRGINPAEITMRSGPKSAMRGRIAASKASRKRSLPSPGLIGALTMVSWSPRSEGAPVPG